MSEPRKHHIIPRFYLENFAKNGKVYVYDLNENEIRHGSPEKICSEKDFYVGQSEGQGIESKLAQNESKAAPIIKSLIQESLGQTPPNFWNLIGFWMPRSFNNDPFSSLPTEDKREFALFVALMHVRTRPFLNNMGKAMVAYEESQLFGSKENSCSDFMQHRERSVERSVVLEDSFIWEYANVLANKIMKMKWSLFMAASNSSFFTSDNPVCLHEEPNPAKEDDVPLEQALNDPSVRVTLPFSPEICWVAYWSDNKPDVYPADKGWMESFNTQRCKWADRLLIASDKEQEILEMGIRFKNLELYNVKTPQMDDGFIAASVKMKRSTKSSK